MFIRIMLKKFYHPQPSYFHLKLISTNNIYYGYNQGILYDNNITEESYHLIKVARRYVGPQEFLLETQKSMKYQHPSTYF